MESIAEFKLNTKTFFVCVKTQDDNIELTLIDESINSWQAVSSLSKLRIKGIELEQYTLLLKEALRKQDPQDQKYGYELKEKAAGGSGGGQPTQFIVRFRITAKGVSGTLLKAATFMLSKVDNQKEYLRKFLRDVSVQNTELQRRNAKVQRVGSQLEELQHIAKDAVEAKVKMEEDYLKKFVLVLNEKKKKIQELQDTIANLQAELQSTNSRIERERNLEQVAERWQQQQQQAHSTVPSTPLHSTKQHANTPITGGKTTTTNSSSSNSTTGMEHNHKLDVLHDTTDNDSMFQKKQTTTTTTTTSNKHSSIDASEDLLESHQHQPKEKGSTGQQEEQDDVADDIIQQEFNEFFHHSTSKYKMLKNTKKQEQQQQEKCKRTSTTPTTSQKSSTHLQPVDDDVDLFPSPINSTSSRRSKKRQRQSTSVEQTNNTLGNITQTMKRSRSDEVCTQDLLSDDLHVSVSD